jgi:hypothetical protein
MPLLLEYAKFEYTQENVKEARKLYELSVDRFKYQDEVWQAYLEFERKLAAKNREKGTDSKSIVVG